jgi:MYXO-CTERM domain-containing protein
MRTSQLLSIAIGAGLAVGCSKDTNLQLGEARYAIVGGEATGPEEQAVVRVFGSPPPGSSEIARACTGTMLAPNLVLTAMHCVSPITGDGQFDCTIDGELTNPPAGTLGVPFDASHIGVQIGPDYKNKPDARGAQLFTTRSTNICTNDLALLVLDTPLDAPIAPLRLDTRAQVGELVTTVGYGLIANSPPPGTLTMRRWRKNVRIVGVEQEGREKARPRTFTLGESVCMGDSGGPALSAQGAVLGVYSTNAAGCEGNAARNFFTMLSEFRLLILEAYEAAGATPWLEGQPAPGTVVDAGASTPDPGTGLDAGHMLDGNLPDATDPPPPPPPATGKRVDSGFCSVNVTGTQSTTGTAALLLGTILVGLGARRRRQRSH